MLASAHSALLYGSFWEGKIKRCISSPGGHFFFLVKCHLLSNCLFSLFLGMLSQVVLLFMPPPPSLQKEAGVWSFASAVTLCVWCACSCRVLCICACPHAQVSTAAVCQNILLSGCTNVVNSRQSEELLQRRCYIYRLCSFVGTVTQTRLNETMMRGSRICDRVSACARSKNFPAAPKSSFLSLCLLSHKQIQNVCLPFPRAVRCNNNWPVLVTKTSVVIKSLFESGVYGGGGEELDVSDSKLWLHNADKPRVTDKIRDMNVC